MRKEDPTVPVWVRTGFIAIWLVVRMLVAYSTVVGGIAVELRFLHVLGARLVRLFDRDETHAATVHLPAVPTLWVLLPYPDTA